MTNIKKPISDLIALDKKLTTDRHHKLTHSLTVEKNKLQLNALVLAQFGIKNPQDVVLFLKSTAGKKILDKLLMEMIKTNRSNLEGLIKRIQIEEHLKEKKHHQLLLFILLHLLHKREAKAHALNEAIQKQIDKFLHQHEPKPQPVEEPSEPVSLKIQIEIYQIIENALNHRLQKKLKHAAALENELINMSQELHDMRVLHHLYNSLIYSDEMHNAALHPELTHELMEPLKAEITSYAEIIAALQTEGKQVEAHEHQLKANALNLKFILLEDISLAHQDGRQFYNKNAHRVNSYMDADFMIPHDKTLTLHEHQFYLHPKSKPFNTLSLQQKNEAKVAYEKGGDNILGIKPRLEQKHTKELSLHHVKKNELTARSETMQKDIYGLAAQLSKVQSARVQLENTLKPTPEAKKTLVLRPVPSSKKPEQDLERTKNVINQCVLHVEKLIHNTSRNELHTAKKRLHDLQHLQQLELSQRLR